MHSGDLVRWEWTAPDGSLQKTTHLVVDFQGRGCVWDGMSIAGDESDPMPGDWQVRVIVNSVALATASFNVAADASAARGRLIR